MGLFGKLTDWLITTPAEAARMRQNGRAPLEVAYDWQGAWHYCGGCGRNLDAGGQACRCDPRLDRPAKWYET